MNSKIDSTFIYPNIRAAAAAVCQRWCEQHGYSDRFLIQSLIDGNRRVRAESLLSKR